MATRDRVIFDPSEIVEQDALTQREKAFVNAVVEGKTPEEACLSAGYTPRSAGGMSAQLLARPQIRKAIKLYLPYIADPKIGLRIAALFAYENVIAALLDGKKYDKNVISVSKDILDRAGYVAVTKSEHSSKSYSLLLKQIQREREGQSEKRIAGVRRPAPALPAYVANPAIEADSEDPDLAHASPTPFGFSEVIQEDREGEE